MARITNKKLSNSVEREIQLELLKEFKNVDSLDDLKGFFRKFMTTGEEILFFRRLMAIYLLKNKKSYREITKILDISRNTISKANDIIQGRGYNKNPDRKRKYSISNGPQKIKSRKIFPKYKGAESII